MIYDSLETFYRLDARRRASPEADFGCHWRQAGFTGQWKVAYVRDTGEIYAVQNNNHTKNPLFVLGQFPPDPEEVFYQSLEVALEGWTDNCTGNPEGLSWIVDKLEDQPSPAAPTLRTWWRDNA